MSFVEESCFHCPYTEEVARECHEFHCGEADLDDFFSKDAFEYEEFRMGKSYCIRLNDAPKTIKQVVVSLLLMHSTNPMFLTSTGRTASKRCSHQNNKKISMSIHPRMKSKD